MSEKIFGLSVGYADVIHKTEDSRILLTRGMNINEEHLRVITRPECEKDENYRHFATYAIIQDTEGKIFVYPRAKGTTEDRLHGMWSIGVGGHVNINTFDNINTLDGLNTPLVNKLFLAATHREISEELFGLPEKEDEKNRLYFDVIQDDVNKVRSILVVNGIFTINDITHNANTSFTYLFDNSNAVGKRHIAVVSRYVINSTDINNLAITQETKGHRWMTLDEIRAEKSSEQGLKLENWSNILIDNFDSLNGNFVPSSCQYGETPFANNTYGKFLKA